MRQIFWSDCVRIGSKNKKPQSKSSFQKVITIMVLWTYTNVIYQSIIGSTLEYQGVKKW